MQMTSDRVMKAISILLIILAVIGLVMSVPLIGQIQRADDSEEGRAFLEELRQQMATELDLPLEEPADPEPTPEPVGTAAEGVEAVEPSADAPEATAEPLQGVRTKDVIDYFMFITTLSIIDAAMQLITGAVGLFRWNKPEKQVLPIVVGGLLLLWMVGRMVFTGITTSTLMSHLMNLLLPVAFIWASISNRKQRKPSLRR